MNARELDGGAECLLFLCLRGGFLHLICLFCCCLLYLQTQGRLCAVRWPRWRMSCLPYSSCQLDFWASSLCDFLYFQEVCKVRKAGTRVWQCSEGSRCPIRAQVNLIEKAQVYVSAAIWAVHHGAGCDAGYRQWWELRLRQG